MKTNTFRELLEENPEKELIFRYDENGHVPANYHITEVKNVIIESVDCGANSHLERQTVVQLWSPVNGESRQGMIGTKAKSIFDKVDKITAINAKAEILFEYGDKHVSTTQFKVSEVRENADSLTIELIPPVTACKASLVNGVSSCC